MEHPLNRAIRAIVEQEPSRSATSTLLAAEITARDLWRRPHNGGHPEPWDLEVWVRSEFGRHLFAFEGGQVTMRETAVAPRLVRSRGEQHDHVLYAER